MDKTFRVWLQNCSQFGQKNVSPTLTIEKLLILIPAYNEQAAVGQVVDGVRAVLPWADILVIDDGSTDSTAHVAATAGAIVLRHPFNLGIGGTVQTGLRFALQEAYDAVIRLDGDGQHDPAGILTLYAALQRKQADLIVGSRFLHPGPKMAIPLGRRLGITLFAGLVTLLTGQRATDTTSGFMALNRRAVSLLAHYMPQDYPEVEGRIICRKGGLTTLELPVRMHSRRAGVSSIGTWPALYYAMKVSLAVLITAFKDIPTLPEELSDVDPSRTADHGHHPQPYFVGGDSSVDPQA